VEWVPQSKEHIEQDEDGKTIEYAVHGSLALVEDGRSYSAWPVPIAAAAVGAAAIATAAAPAANSGAM
jgi:hypothetical protein